jgi:hypothetical protein
MARPKVNSEDKKNKLLQIKLSIKDMLRLKEMAKNNHDTITNFARRCILVKLNGIK